ncbi:glycosyltransferase [Leuconostoc miyukkimchii]|uniref:glycosyltransferase n=1 Tax=Leuconostoc miyukkimchii TaxID=910540 RepID=UPI001C7CF26B|nr:glycosyltransferase [Leuconostoc miyukkimchii]
MNEKEVSILTSTVPEYFGGRTQSLLKRARLFDEFGINVRIITTNFNQNYSRIINSLVERNYVSKNVSFLNIFDYFKGTDIQENNVDLFIQQKFGNIDHYDVVKRDENMDYYDKNTSKRIFSLRYNDYKIILIDEFISQKRPKYRYYVSDQGQVSKKRTYVEGTWNIICDDILKNDFETIVSFKFVNNKKSEVVLFLKKQLIFKNEKQFFKFFFDEIFLPNEKVINDARLLDKPLLDTNQSVDKFFQIHSTHLQDPADYHSGIKKSYKSLLNSDENINIIVLTNEQKRVILGEVPHKEDKLYVIPHSISNKKPIKVGNTHHAVIVSRLVKEKNIEEGIIAFSMFQKIYSDYVLDIYGNGDNLENLEQLTNTLNLGNSVIFHGYTDNPNHAYQGADFSIVSSNYEAFALNVLESIANGTQVVSYDVNFGPKEILGNSAGFISQQRTPESLAQCMIEAVEKPKLLEDIVSRANEYSDKIFLERWLKILEIQ